MIVDDIKLVPSSPASIGESLRPHTSDTPPVCLPVASCQVAVAYGGVFVSKMVLSATSQGLQALVMSMWLRGGCATAIASGEVQLESTCWIMRHCSHILARSYPYVSVDYLIRGHRPELFVQNNTLLPEVP